MSEPGTTTCESWARSARIASAREAFQGRVRLTLQAAHPTMRTDTMHELAELGGSALEACLSRGAFRPSPLKHETETLKGDTIQAGNLGCINSAGRNRVVHSLRFGLCGRWF